MISWLSLGEVSRFVKKHSLGPETFKAKWMRRGFNLIPNNHFSGGRIVYASPCKRRGIATLPFNYRNVSALGTMFGGSMYSAIDSMGVALLFQHVDIREYLIADTHGTMKHIKPGRRRLFAIINLKEEDEVRMYRELRENGESRIVFDIDIVDVDDNLIAQSTKSVLVRKRGHRPKRVKV